MNLPGGTLLIIGLGASGTLAIYGYLKMLRSDKLLFILTVLSAIFGIIGLGLRSEATEMVNGNGATAMISPFVYIVSYAMLRWIYKKIYKMEPTYNRSSWYDHEEGRKQNWLDVIVHIIPMILCWVVPILIDEIL